MEGASDPHLTLTRHSPNSRLSIHWRRLDILYVQFKKVRMITRTDPVISLCPSCFETSDYTCAKGIGQQETIWKKHSQRLTDIVKNNDGVWISTKLFYIVGSLSLLSIITIVIEIAFYVYFHWFQ